MHEYSLMAALLERVQTEAQAHGASTVTRVVVSIGDLSGVEVDLLAWAFELLREGTVCSSARLEVVRVAPRWTCPQCRLDDEPSGARRCPACAAPLRLVAGRELILQTVELEVPAQASG